MRAVNTGTAVYTVTVGGPSDYAAQSICTIKADMHYPHKYGSYIRAVFTAPTGVFFDTRAYGPYIRYVRVSIMCPYMRAVNTGRIYGYG